MEPYLVDKDAASLLRTLADRIEAGQSHYKHFAFYKCRGGWTVHGDMKLAQSYIISRDTKAI